MNPQQLHTNSATHTHDFYFYDHRRGEDVGREHAVRESDLLNTIISFPSTSAQPFLLPRNSLQERIPSNFFIQGSNSTTVSFDVGASRDESEQLMSRRDVCESTIGTLGTDKLRDKQPLSSMDSARYDAGDNILSRFASDHPTGRGGLWPFSGDRNDCIRSSVSATSDSSLQLPINSMRLGENLHNFSGAHNIITTMLQGNSDPGGGAARYGASGAHCRDGLWEDDHGTELLLLPGISGVGSDGHHQSIPHAHSHVGRASVLFDNLKPLSEYLNVQSSDQVREQNPSIPGFSTFASTNASSLRDLSLSLSAQENSQHVLYRGSTGAGSTCSNLQNSGYLKSAQKVLGEVCSQAIAEGAAGSFPLSGNAGATVGFVNAIGSSDLSSARAPEAPAGVGSSLESNSLHAFQQLRSSIDQAMVPAAMAHQQQQQLQDHHALASRIQNDYLQVVPFMDRSQLELKRRRLFIMLEELEKRFKRYEEQMQVLVIALETSGVGLMLEGAAPYKEVAGQAIQKRFTYLRDAILASETFIMGGFSGDGAATSSHPLPGVGECDQAGTTAATRFRLLDQQLRHQRALQQVGLFPQPPWRPQRGLPERSVSLLRAWLFDHFLHPYPKDTEKVLLARQTGLTRNQVSNWFINARVRLWKPMVEEMYQEEMKTAELRRTSGQGNPKKFIPTSTNSSRNATAMSEFHLDQSKKHAQPDFDNHVMAMQDLGSISAMQGIETSRFFYKHNEIISDSQPRPFHNHQDEQVSFAPSIEVPSGKAAMSTMLDAAQQCGTHTWPFIQHQNVSFDAQEQQHYCNSDISAALMRFGSSGGVTLTLGLQQHSSGGGSMNCAGPSPFERSPDDVNAAHRWCE